MLPTTSFAQDRFAQPGGFVNVVIVVAETLSLSVFNGCTT